MKTTKLFFVLATMLALSVGFSSCSNDDDDGIALAGSTWVFEERGSGWSETITITFSTATTGVWTFTWTETGHGGGTESESFTYVLNYPAITITIPAFSETATGVITGRTMNIMGMIFTRR